MVASLKDAFEQGLLIAARTMGLSSAFGPAAAAAVAYEEMRPGSLKKAFDEIIMQQLLDMALRNHLENLDELREDFAEARNQYLANEKLIDLLQKDKFNRANNGHRDLARDAGVNIYQSYDAMLAEARDQQEALTRNVIETRQAYYDGWKEAREDLGENASIEEHKAVFDEMDIEVGQDALNDHTLSDIEIQAAKLSYQEADNNNVDNVLDL